MTLPVCFASLTFTSRSEARTSTNVRPVVSLISIIGRPAGFERFLSLGSIQRPPETFVAAGLSESGQRGRG